jgi:hypothetical protein
MFQPLLEGRPSAKAFLSISTLVHSYCQQNRNCKEVEQIKDIMRKIEGVLGSSCQSPDTSKQQLLILALKAIGNAGIFTGSSDTLRKCTKVKQKKFIFLGFIIIGYNVVCK